MKKLETVIIDAGDYGTVLRFADESQVHNKINELIDETVKFKKELTKLHNRLFILEEKEGLHDLK